ncbi:hypothetical protein FRX31_024839 [Thalictrum thalictroides]|uniref:Zinc ion binding / nucleic acid binding protein n=1 Tax=Thalictrum thalictroides TaxID=46969 RepID=A0A7J6VN32_THATH|nr:hypothetical protein FRX31_024839 [Thalictrum thalictroides]
MAGKAPMSTPLGDQPNISITMKPLDSSSRAPVTWSALFHRGNASKLKTTLRHFQPVLVDGVAEVPAEVIEQGDKEWKDYLVGCFIGKRLPYPLVRDVLQKQWKLQNFEMVADSDVFYFKFQSEEDKMMVFEKDVPKRLWSDAGLGFLGSLLGTPVCLDDATDKKTRLKFAKVCVEVDFQCSFPRSLKVKLGEEISVVKVEYDWIPSKCSKCSSFGHLTNKCNRKVTPLWQARTDDAGPSCVRDSDGVEIQPHILKEVEISNAKEVVEWSTPPTSPTRVPIAQAKAQDKVISANRFSSLQDLDEEEDGSEAEFHETSLVIYKEPLQEEIVVETQYVEAAQFPKVNKCNVYKPEVALVDPLQLLEADIDHANTSDGGQQAQNGDDVNAIDSPVKEYNQVVEVLLPATDSLMVVGDENMDSLEFDSTQLETEEFDEALETESESLERFHREQEMYEALVTENDEDYETDQGSEEEVEVFKDHIMKELPPIIVEKEVAPLRTRQSKRVETKQPVKFASDPIKKPRGRPKGA